MANYNIDIGVKVQAQQLDKFNKKIKLTGTLIDNANKSIKNYQKGNLELVRSINGVNTVLKNAGDNFKAVAVGTPQATRAAKEFVKAEQLVNKTLAEQQKLLDDVSGKTAKKAAADNKRLQEGLLKLEKKSTTQLEEKFETRKKFQEEFKNEVNKVVRQRQEENKLLQANVQQTKKTVAEEIKKKFSIIAAGKQRRKNLQQLNRAATLEDRINKVLAKRGMILSANGQKIIKNNQARNAGGRGGSRFRNAIGSGIIGGGFPLLFGQGPTAAIGGGIGGLAGGLIGGQMGFALSIAGTTIGQALEDLATALAKPTENIENLITKLGIAETPTAKLALRLEKLGLTSSAATLLLDEFEEKFGLTTGEIEENTKKNTS